MPALTAQIFVSYAHADNQSFDAQARGWIAEFVDKLQKAIAMRPGGSEVTCWMDYRLEPQRRVDATLLNHIRESRCILAFMSPRYLESEWCQKEMNAFLEWAGAHANNRVFLVELLPTEQQWRQLHPRIENITEIQFWTSSLGQPDPIILGWPVPDPRGDRPYWTGLNRLATIIARQIQMLPSLPPDTPAPPSTGFELPAPPAPPSGPLSIVINAEKTDLELGKAAQKLLKGLNVHSTIALERRPREHFEKYRRYLATLLNNNHGVLIIYGLAPLSWVHSQHLIARNLLAAQRTGTWSGLLDGPPEEKLHHGLGGPGLMELDCRQGLNVEPLKRFVDALRNGGGHV
ncbi:toll/interleukin-1 receptor domain-containing protein [Methylomagnum ishizawai]|uniref:toll/interleukin-1 receptor domain-containing protein n=1 Tax=Methylomagnum ishizawai TaxID=1760988 RepID=UPI001C3256CA|nr:toll/interleukin-1 receptor domain-containing protein [Methylomagnum ishizawai]BBL73070.1 hypothetical protein MishRS11D_01680 [Methylomagnum ishizawai]